MGEIPQRMILCHSHRQAMLAHILACFPEEGCGLIGGRFNPGGARAEAVLPVTNQDHSPVRFCMEPNELVKALYWLDENNLDLAAIFHSHPGGPAGPSVTDLAEFAYPGVLYLILSPDRDPLDWQMRAYWIDGHGQVVEVPLGWDATC